MFRVVRKNKKKFRPTWSVFGSGQLTHYICACIALWAAAPASAQTAPPAQEYHSVIEQARAGRHTWALNWLKQQSQLYPNNHRIKYDQLIVASWAGQQQDAIRLYEQLPLEAHPIPSAALAAAARAYRDDRQWPIALKLYREGKRRYPGDGRFTLGETLVLADSGEVGDALDLARALAKQAPGNALSHVVLSYTYRLNQQPFAALAAATEAYRLAPDKPGVADEYIQALSASGLSDAALRTARAHPNLVLPARLSVLEADHAAELTRLASQPSRQESSRYIVADRALDAYAQLASDTPASSPDLPTQASRVRIDRLIALHARRRMDEVISEYESLDAQGIPVPHYALGHVASAYLDIQQPEKAAELYLEILNAERALQVDPSVRLSHQSGLFYSFLEAQQFDRAQETISAAQQEQPVWHRQKGTPLPQPNELNLAINQQEALAHYYADDTPQAQASLEHMTAKAPGHSGLRAALAEVYLARGWPRRAERELKLAEAQTPRAQEIVSEQGKVALSLQEWRKAELLLNDVAARYPEDAQVRRLERDWERHNRAELRINAQKGIASNSPVAGNGDLRIDTVIYTPPLNYNWRGFAGGGYAKADFDEYDVDYHWYRAGAEWRSRNITAELEASSHHYGQGAKTGVRAQASYEMDDQWQVGGQVAFRSAETPLRALANNITSNRLDAYVQWRANERREWRLIVSPSRFSDGNRRLEASLSGRERLYTTPHLKLDALLEVSASHNTQEDVPYFNPRADLSVLPGVALTHTLYRRYDTELEQRFTLGAGIYAQRGFGSGAITALGYGLRYRFNELLNVGVSVTGVSRPYDGQREREARVMFDLQLRF